MTDNSYLILLSAIVFVYFFLYLINFYLKSPWITRDITLGGCIAYLICFTLITFIPICVHTLRTKYMPAPETIHIALWEDFCVLLVFIFVLFFWYLIQRFYISARISKIIKFRYILVNLWPFWFFLVVTRIADLPRPAKRRQIEWTRGYTKSIYNKSHEKADILFNDENCKKMFAACVVQRLKFLTPFGVETLSPDSLKDIYYSTETSCACKVIDSVLKSTVKR